MDFLCGNIKTLYFKFLAAAFGGALITSIYSLVDMAVVGQYQGSEGTAALAVVAPIWNIIYSLGLLMGIGGSVLLSTEKGKQISKCKHINEYFTAALYGTLFLAVAAWLIMIFFDRSLLMFFGAEDHLLTLARTYIQPIKFVLPCFMFTQMLAAFLRNDSHPGLATAAILAGGLFNIFGDIIFVFGFDMGIYGAGLATAIGSFISMLLMLSHFFTQQNTLAIIKTENMINRLKEICITGFSTFFIDIAMGILTILFNRQIMKYLNTDALSIYGVLVNVSTFAQCCAYSAGQAAQPIISVNYGARAKHRIIKTLKYALITVLFFSAFWTLTALLLPNQIVRLFMAPSFEILSAAPTIIRSYGLSFILLPFNIFSTYYFQALLKPRAALVVSVARGLIVSGFFIMTLPLLDADLIWLAMPITELIVALYAVFIMKRCTDHLFMEKAV